MTTETEEGRSADLKQPELTITIERTNQPRFQWGVGLRWASGWESHRLYETLDAALDGVPDLIGQTVEAQR